MEVFACTFSDPADPPEWSDEHDVRGAAAMRAEVEATKPTMYCAVCACRRCQREMEGGTDQGWVSGFYLTHAFLAPLRADGAQTEECPRAGVTITEHDGVRYCMAARAELDNVEYEDDLGPDSGHPKLAAVLMCTQCRNSLGRGQVPPCSLVRVDVGTVADAWDRLPQRIKDAMRGDLGVARPSAPMGVLGITRKPRYVEAAVLSILVPVWNLVVFRPKWLPGAAMEDSALSFLGHVVAVPSGGHRGLVQLFPMSPSEIGKYITVRDCNLHAR